MKICFHQKLYPQYLFPERREMEIISSPIYPAGIVLAKGDS